MISRDIVVGENPTVVLARHDIYLLNDDYKQERDHPRSPWNKEKLVQWASVAAGEQNMVFDDDIDLINWWLGDEAVVRTEKGEEILLWLRNDKGAFTHYTRSDVEKGTYLLSKDGQKVGSLRAGEFSWSSPIAGAVFVNGEVLDNSRQPNYEKAMCVLRAGGHNAHEEAFRLLWGDVLGTLSEDTLLSVVSTSY